MSLLNNLNQPLIMGILNVTPDSFSDGGQYAGVESALQQAQSMIAEGVDIIDIGGESTRPGSDPVSAELQIQRVVPVIRAIRQQLSDQIPIDVGIILMHSQGKPKDMQIEPYYADVDPGIGFGKRKQDNLDLLAHLDKFVATGYPVLLGTSRKRFMGSICEVSKPTELISATAATTALAVMQGVQLFRVHDVQENKQAADVAWAIQQAG